MSYTVSSGTLNSTIPYHTLPYHTPTAAESVVAEATKLFMAFVKTIQVSKYQLTKY